MPVGLCGHVGLQKSGQPKGFVSSLEVVAAFSRFGSVATPDPVKAGDRPITPNTEVQTGRRPAVSGLWMTTSQPKKTSIGKVYHFSVLVFFAGAVGGKREASGILHSFRVVAYFSESARRSVGV